MIYLFNKTATPWNYTKANDHYARLTSNRTNTRTGKEDYIGIAVSSELPIATENFETYMNMVSECAMISDQLTTIDFRYKDLNPRINKLSNPDAQYNVDVFLASIPLNGGIVTQISGANILGYRAVNNEFFVYFFPKRNQNTYETPVFTIANASTYTEVDYIFSPSENGGYCVTTEIYSLDADKVIEPLKVRKYRPRRATKLIFVRESDINFFTAEYGQKFSRHIIVEVNNNNIDEMITEYAKKQNYKAATFYTNANRGADITYSEGDYIDKILKNFHHVNAVLHSGFSTIVK